MKRCVPNAARRPSRITSTGASALKQPLGIARAKPEGQWHHGDLRAALIEWGSYLLDHAGIGGLSLRAAARLAGVSQGAPAHHFTDLNGFLAALAAKSFKDMVQLRKDRLAQLDAGDAAGRLRAVMVAYVEFARAHPARFHLMFGPGIEQRGQYPELVEEGRASFQILRSVVAPLVSPARLDALKEAEISFAVWAATHGVASLAVSERRAPLASSERLTSEQSVDVLVRFCLAALRA